jgi:hypothetical protein
MKLSPEERKAQALSDIAQLMGVERRSCLQALHTVLAASMGNAKPYLECIRPWAKG